jgi:FdhE protein
MTDSLAETDPVQGAYLPPEARAALARELEREPEWRPWLALLRRSMEEADRAHGLADIRFAAARPARSPLLEGARIHLDVPAAAAYLADLMAVATGRTRGNRGGLRETSPLRWVAAGLRQAPNEIAGVAEIAGMTHGAAGALAHFTVLPLLLEAGRRAVPMLPQDWTEGYCPVCGSWPTLVELRGLERSRVLRCARCAAGWSRHTLHCAFCDERDHRRQGALVPDQEKDLLRIEVCEACRGYVKTLTTLRPLAPWALHLHDLDTLALEISAVERGYQRPEIPGWTLSVGLSARPDVPAGGQ